MDRGKLALIYRSRKCKKGKDRRSPLVYSRKLAEHDNFPHAVSRRYRDRGQRLQNPDRAKNQSDCKIHYRALLEKKISGTILKDACSCDSRGSSSSIEVRASLDKLALSTAH